MSFKIRKGTIKLRKFKTDFKKIGIFIEYLSGEDIDVNDLERYYSNKEKRKSII